MENNKYNILVLCDLKAKPIQTLQYAAKLAKEIDADVEFFYAKEAREVAQIENPLSAMRVMSEVCIKTDKEVRDLVTPISKENGIKIKTSFEIGNVKNEIKNHIETLQPDMIVLGERKEKRFNLLGNNITRLVNKNYDGVVIVATDKNVLDANGNVSLDNLGLKDNIANYNIKVKNDVTL